MSTAPDRAPDQARDQARAGAGSSDPQYSRLIAALLALACILVAAVGLKLSEPDTGSIDTITAVGETVTLNGAELTITRVRSGSVVRFGAADDPEAETVKTSGLFLVVTARLAAPHLAATVGAAGSVTLSEGDRTYANATDQVLSADAGFESTADFVFEVDPDRLAGIRANVKQGEIISGLSSRAVVDLGITSANVAQWRGTEGRTVDVEQYPSTQAIP